MLSRRRYTVRRFDTLWDIAKREYGDGAKWPVIAHQNKLRVPTIIVIGQRLEIPELTHRTNVSVPARYTPRVPRFNRYANAVEMAFPECTFKLFESKIPEIYYPTPVGLLKVTISLTGTVSFRKKGSLSNVSVTDLKEIEMRAKEEAQFSLWQLTRDARVKLDLTDMSSPKVIFSCGLEAKMKMAGGQSVAYKVKGEYKKITFSCENSSANFEHQGMIVQGTYGWSISVEGDGLNPHLRPQSVTNTYRTPSSALPSPRSTSDWIPVIIVALGSAVITYFLPSLRLQTQLNLPYAPHMLFDQGGTNLQNREI